MGQEDPLEKGMAIHSSILAWRTPRTEEPGGLQSMGLQRVRHDWAANTHTGLDYVPKHTWISLLPQPTCQSNLCGQSQVTTHMAEAASLRNILSCYCTDFWRDLNASHSPFSKKGQTFKQISTFGFVFFDRLLFWRSATLLRTRENGENGDSLSVLYVRSSFIASVLLKAMNLPSFSQSHWQTIQTLA